MNYSPLSWPEETQIANSKPLGFHPFPVGNSWLPHSCRSTGEGGGAAHADWPPGVVGRANVWSVKCTLPWQELPPFVMVELPSEWAGIGLQGQLKQRSGGVHFLTPNSSSWLFQWSAGLWLGLAFNAGSLGGSSGGITALAACSIHMSVWIWWNPQRDPLRSTSDYHTKMAWSMSRQSSVSFASDYIFSQRSLLVSSLYSSPYWH